MGAGHLPAAECVEGFTVALEQDRLVAVDQLEPFLTVLGMGTVEEAPVDRIRPRAADPHVRVGQQHLAGHAEQGLTHQGVGQNTGGGEAGGHSGTQVSRGGGWKFNRHAGVLRG
ncbi:hypothetical protein [Streptomyces sp. NRRL S-340]|uniref:hypothetical protein n=1 Tax=Streptomyces sp. NRRL S-340 TaxID=1463901 RepID=UPI00055A0FDF|nr:hypothetical protein [Streptomyces sp. NRRL S-340]